MLIGAHVSQASGLAKAVERGVERGCNAIQIFNQSPRMWRPTAYDEDDFAEFREAIDATDIDAVLIHAVYLLNCASDDLEIRAKTLASLTHSLRVGHAIGAHGVVVHAGSAKSGDVEAAIERAGATIREALAQSEGCELHVENTAGAGGTLGRSFGELARIIAAAGDGKRLAVCLDSCHLLASGYDIRTAAGMDSVLREARRVLGRGRVRSLHLKDIKKGFPRQTGAAEASAEALVPLGTGQIDANAGAVSAGTFNAVQRGVDIRIVAPMSFLPQSGGATPC